MAVKLSVELSIDEMQDAILAKGWQYTEHIYNDGLGCGFECSIELTTNQNPSAIGSCRFVTPWPNDMPKSIGWGRFSRRFCWAEAYDCIVVERKYDNVEM